MDTSVISCKKYPKGDNSPTIPSWALTAARQGTRRALELLRSPILPEAIIIASNTRADVIVGSLYDREEGLYSAHSPYEIAISYWPTVSRLNDKNRQDQAYLYNYLLYCAAKETTLFALTIKDPGIDKEVQCISEVIATIASGFAMDHDLDGEDLFGAVRFFLQCLSTIRSSEGSLSLWRGETKKMIDDFSRNIGFDCGKDVLDRKGIKIKASDIHVMIDYIEGKTHWPFSSSYE